MTEPREALATAVLDACQNTASEPRDDREWSLDVADRLIAAGVHLGAEARSEGPGLDALREAAMEMLAHIDAYNDAMGHSYCASQVGEIDYSCTCGFDERHDRWVVALAAQENPT